MIDILSIQVIFYRTKYSNENLIDKNYFIEWLCDLTAFCLGPWLVSNEFDEYFEGSNLTCITKWSNFDTKIYVNIWIKRPAKIFLTMNILSIFLILSEAAVMLTSLIQRLNLECSLHSAQVNNRLYRPQEFEFSTWTKSSKKSHVFFDKSVSNCQVWLVLPALLRNWQLTMGRIVPTSKISTRTFPAGILSSD